MLTTTLSGLVLFSIGGFATFLTRAQTCEHMLMGLISHQEPTRFIMDKLRASYRLAGVFFLATALGMVALLLSR